MADALNFREEVGEHMSIPRRDVSYTAPVACLRRRRHHSVSTRSKLFRRGRRNTGQCDAHVHARACCRARTLLHARTQRNATQRKVLGGEEAVMNYTHSLAAAGGALLADRSGNKVRTGRCA